MPKARAKLDDVVARLLERETLFAIAAVAVLLVQGWREGGAAAVVSVAMTWGRSLVKSRSG